MRAFSSLSALLVLSAAPWVSAEYVGLPKATLFARQAQVAAGGGGGAPSSVATLQSISGYTAPPSAQLPSPTNYSSGSILNTAQIPGWNDTTRPNSGAAIYGGGGNKLSAAQSRYQSCSAVVAVGVVAAAAGSLFMII
ncbi:hypothetical protein K437DRAFT_260754 [Tilletiaria anomala UBC 951]|uniref:Uncharacterized protein n=1 Tax=Tilletiaria anomala (strain ATCC 24038 / CBS 436.72 / UBC 951) TaxID=1037660 RepID=A0A066WHJ0_TILAU|nr:uncharacterized protein K437DRAFT_260754 [Tilletiaria anomala UBC 951]KDN53276.1 hypothetical protein K437DRAFT_260754 [Tilletiaria anomala UBC 951]